jgi:hypothetical protein
MRRILKELNDGALRYTNAHANYLSGSNWSCTPADATAIAVAFECSSAVYESDQLLQVEGFQCQREGHIVPTRTGDVKEALFTSFKPLETSSQNVHFPALVIAVRGTHNKVDHLVNLNGEMRDATDFIVRNDGRLTRRILK